MILLLINTLSTVSVQVASLQQQIVSSVIGLHARHSEIPVNRLVGQAVVGADVRSCCCGRTESQSGTERHLCPETSFKNTR